MNQPFSIQENEIITSSSYLNAEVSLKEFASPLPSSSIEEGLLSYIRHSQDSHQIFYRKELFSDKFNENCIPILNVINEIMANLDSQRKSMLIKKLKGHVGIYEDGNPWIDLEACWLLNLHKDVNKINDCLEFPSEPVLPEKIKFALTEGRHVPIQHVIFGLHLAQFNSQILEYPYEFTNIVPIDFIQKINRSDVLRAVNIHSLFLGSNFPLIGVQFANLKEVLWQFMFRHKFSAVAGMELYNEVFYKFTCNLGQGNLLSLNHIPHELIEKVKKCHKTK